MAGFEYDVNIDFNKVAISKSEIENILPHWKTKVIELYRFKNSNFIEITILVAANSETDIQRWIHDYEEKSKCSYSIRSSEKCAGTKVKFKQRLKCVHNTRRNNNDPSNHRRSKNSNCPSTLAVTLKTVRKKYLGRDKSKAPDPSMPCEIKIIPNHNHSTSVDALRFRQVKKEIREKLLSLFESGYSPGNALECLKMDIRLKRDNFYEILADRSSCPDYMYCYHLYTTVFKKKIGLLEVSADLLIQKVDDFNKDMNTKSAVIKFIDDDYVICVCSPLMQRVHETIEEASQIVVLDSTRTADSCGPRIFVLLTTSHCGDLPLAVFITTSECAQSISVGFQLLKEIMGDRIFYSTIDGPTLFMTEDSAAEHAAIQSEWPKSTNLLCIFRVLQSVWRWLMKTTNGIKLDHVNKLFQDFRNVMYASNEEECAAAFQHALAGSDKYPKYQSFLNNYWDQKSLWVLCYRNHSRQGQNIDNLSEAATRLLKEKIFERIKAFNLIEVVDFMMTKYVSYYERRLLDAAHNITVPNILDRLISLPPSVELIEHIKNLADSVYLVPSEKESDVSYVVNIEVLTCSCVVGRKGNMCKHIDWIHFVKSDEFRENFEDEGKRSTFFFIATGSPPPRNWLDPSVEEISPSEKIECKSPTNYTEKIQIIWEPSDDNLEEVAEEKYILKGTEIINGSKSTTNNTKNIEIIWVPPFGNSEEAGAEQYTSKGKEAIDGMSEIFSQYLKQSPLETSKALQVLFKGLKSIKTVSGFATACHSFSSGIVNRRNKRRCKVPVQLAAVNRGRVNLSGRSSAGGRARKCDMVAAVRSRK